MLKSRTVRFGSIDCFFPVMAINRMARPGVSSGSGHQPPPIKKSKTLNDEANRGESYKSSTQPGRVSLSQISWHPSNRGGQGILPMHAHVVAKSICDQGTSIRRYNSVRLVEVPEAEKDAWLKGVQRKINLNSQLSRFQAISHSGRMYATLTCSHFVEAHKLIHEGQRHYMDNKEKQRLQLRDDDEEGQQIQERGVNATVYAPELWGDTSAIPRCRGTERGVEGRCIWNRPFGCQGADRRLSATQQIHHRLLEGSLGQVVHDGPGKLEQGGLGASRRFQDTID